MMKHTKKLFALLLAVIMVVALAVPAAAASVTITPSTNDEATHSYEAYQIFAGDIDEDGKTLINITWGTGIDQSKLGTLATALNALKTGTEFEDLTATSIPAAFAKALNALSSTPDDAKAQAIAEALAAVLSTTTAGTGSSTGVTELDPGYYLVKDKDDSLDEANGAYTRYILQLLGEETVTEKAEVPTVDKQVQDEEDDAEAGARDGWGETADHAINESFQFKLTATIPADVELKNYDSYKAIFHDTMSNGITFESIESVKVNGKDVTAYTCSATANQAGGTWAVTFNDILPLLTDAEKEAAVTIEVVYNAHLNENATVYNTDETDESANPNTVSLEYSNNPNAGGSGDTGKTPDDTVFVFTYKVDNTKYSEKIAEGSELAGAGFTLYDSTGTTAINLIWDSEKSAYRPATATEAKAEDYSPEMTSQADGTFNIIGLDTGTYVLKETTVPAGFNPAADVTIKIVATHVENASTTGADLTLESTSENLDNDVVNKTGTVLPSTGGIGTTIFYVVGGIMVAAALVLLITKKRVGEEN